MMTAESMLSKRPTLRTRVTLFFLVCLKQVYYFYFLLQPCPAWSTWNFWAACSVSCGGGERFRTRACINGIAGLGGCEGLSEMFEGCMQQVGTEIV